MFRAHLKGLATRGLEVRDYLEVRHVDFVDEIFKSDSLLNQAQTAEAGFDCARLPL